WLAAKRKSVCEYCENQGWFRTAARPANRPTSAETPRRRGPPEMPAAEIALPRRFRLLPRTRTCAILHCHRSGKTICHLALESQLASGVSHHADSGPPVFSECAW